jgi:DNA-directed RNA polymerase specialized sigma24 family protein
VSTRCAQEKRVAGDGWRAAGRRLRDLLEEVALVSHSRRELLLRMNRFRLRREDLEDAYSQATFELLAQVRRGGNFTSHLHVANALELRFLSRVRDCRRALGGRSPMQAALEEAVVLDSAGEASIELVDRAANVETLVLLRHELRTIGGLAKRLSADQRLVLGAQLSGETCAEFCTRVGWSREKYRKVAQRARLRLRTSMRIAESGVPATDGASEEISGPTYDDATPHT